jgi:hypothetical protein
MDHQKELFTTFQKKTGRTDFVLVMFSLCIMKSNLYHFKQQQQQQQQQHSLLSQASWGRLEMKPKRDEKQGDMN